MFLMVTAREKLQCHLSERYISVPSFLAALTTKLRLCFGANQGYGSAVILPSDPALVTAESWALGSWVRGCPVSDALVAHIVSDLQAQFRISFSIQDYLRARGKSRILLTFKYQYAYNSTLSLVHKGGGWIMGC